MDATERLMIATWYLLVFLFGAVAGWVAHG